MKTRAGCIVILLGVMGFAAAVMAAGNAPGTAAASAVPAAPTANKPAAVPAKPAIAPAVKSTRAIKPAPSGGARAKNLDLRHCLDLASNAEIAKCAGE